MNKTKIEWCDYTWNPVTGCKHGCTYCYARKIAERFKGSKAWPVGFEPMFHPERLLDPGKIRPPQTIFVCSMSDIFGSWNNPNDIHKIFEVMEYYKLHTFVLLTKAPENIDKILFGNPYYLGSGDYLPNVWIGTTVEKQSTVHRIKTLVNSAPYFKKFVSFEPLLERIECNLDGIDQVIIGAQTNPPVEVTPEMVQPIGLATCPGVTPKIKMFCKDSMPTWAKCRRELAWGLHK